MPDCLNVCATTVEFFVNSSLNIVTKTLVFVVKEGTSPNSSAASSVRSNPIPKPVAGIFVPDIFSTSLSKRSPPSTEPPFESGIMTSHIGPVEYEKERAIVGSNLNQSSSKPAFFKDQVKILQKIFSLNWQEDLLKPDKKRFVLHAGKIK